MQLLSMEPARANFFFGRGSNLCTYQYKSPPPPGLGWGFDMWGCMVNAPPLGHFLDATPHLIPTQGWGLGGDLYPSGGVVKLTALLCFPKHTKTLFSLSGDFYKSPTPGRNF